MNTDYLNPTGMHHINYLVEDIPAAVDGWVETLGAGPFFWLGHHIEFDEATFCGEPCVLDHSAVIGRWGDTFVELSHVYDISPSPFEAFFVGPNGNPSRVGHTSYIAPDAHVEGKRLEALGMAPFFRARRGPVEINFHDAWSVLGHPVELHQKSAALDATFSVISAAADGWDGSDQLRTFPS
jgi:hypothetical protein